MKKSVKVTLFTALAAAFTFGMMSLPGCGGGGGGSSPAPSPTYTGTLFQASQEGGHIGVFPVTINPANTSAPITVDTANQSKIQLNGSPSDTANHTVFHDIRFDDPSNGGKNATKIYYSAIESRPATTSVADIGYVDLTQASYGQTNNGVNSVIDIDPGAADNIAWALSLMAPGEFGTTTRIEYCASAYDQTNGVYFPMSMSFPAYVDAVPVAKLAAGAQGSVSNELHSGTSDFTRTWIWQIDPAMANLDPAHNYFGNPPLAFIHGGPSPDGKMVYMVMNVVSGLSQTNNLAGALRVYLVKASDLESASTATPGTSTMTPSDVMSQTTITVAPSDSTTSGDGSLQGTIAYRASFTPDGKYILQSGSDRMVILQVADLAACESSPTPTTACAMTLYADTTGTTLAERTSMANSVTKPGQITSGLGAGTWGGIEVHDVISTPDSKYAILSVRYYADQHQADQSAVVGGLQEPGIKTSGVQLYDINNKKFIGDVVPTCGSSATQCHAAVDPTNASNDDYRTRATCGVLFKSAN